MRFDGMVEKKLIEPLSPGAILHKDINQHDVTARTLTQITAMSKVVKLDDEFQDQLTDIMNSMAAKHV